ncbi:MAG: PIG-L family deacetylase [Rhodanobacter sp.]|nr:PIG-L family deacetylase [Rhodanobacter sp.]
MTGGNEPVAGSVDDTPVFSAQTRLLVVAPHPDDETIATGLLIQQVRAADGEVQILLLTAGDNNPWPQRWLERRLLIRAQDRERWGRRRHAEALQALQRLDVPSQALHALGLPDMGITDCLLRPDTAVVDAVAKAIEQFQPTLIAVPALADRHPDHGSAHVLVRLALTRQRPSPPVLTYLVHGRTLGVSSVEIGGTSTQRSSKRSALLAHCTQMALSAGRMRRMAERPECYDRLPAQSESARALPWQPPGWLGRWLRLSVVTESGAQTWRWCNAPLHRDDHGAYHLTSLAGAEDSARFVRLAWDLHTPWIFDYWGWCEI